jgi:hypothetical protein
VYVIDAKNHRGKVRIDKPLLGAPKLLIAGRDRTALIDGLDRQVAAVRDAMIASGHREVPVHGVLCFAAADLPLLGTLRTRGHLLLYPKALAKRLNADGPLQADSLNSLALALATALRPA